jgi:hypothetical protein
VLSVLREKVYSLTAAGLQVEEWVANLMPESFLLALHASR